MKAIVGLWLLICIGIGSLASAQEFDLYGGGGDSFRRTCRVRYEDGRRIIADCADTRGRWVYNDFNRRGCIGDIGNNDGYLQCARGGGYGLPPGSYQQSCVQCRADGQYLSCQCADVNGRYFPTTLYYARCNGEIANQNSQLVCP